MGVLSVVFLSHPQLRQTGDWLHRCEWPARALSQHAEVHLLQTTHPNWLEKSLQADVLVLLMLAEPYFEHIIEARKRAGKVTVYEINDEIELEGTVHTTVYGYLSHVEQSVKHLMPFADALEFSSPFLMEKYGQESFAGGEKPQRVFVNQLPESFSGGHFSAREAVGLEAEDVQSRNAPCSHPTGSWSGGHFLENQKKQRQDTRLVLGWGGSHGHLLDIKVLAKWLGTWPNKKRVEWRIMAAPELVKVFEKQGLRVKQVKTGSMTEYLKFLSGLDICFLFTGDDDFSAGRSDGKFLEAASQKTMVLCRKNRTYAQSFEDGKTGVFFADEAELHEKLDHFLQHPEQIAPISEAAHEFVLNTRTQAHGAADRFAFYASLTPHRTGTRTGLIYDFDAVNEEKLYQALEHHKHEEFDQALTLALEVFDAKFFTLTLWLLLANLFWRYGEEENAQNCENHAEILLANALSRVDASNEH